MSTYCFDAQFEGLSSTALAGILDPKHCHTKAQRDKFFTEHQIKAVTARLRDAAVEKVFRSYHPAGYGTRLVAKAHCPKTGLYWAIVRRSNSCD